jgi:hypothetical protein
MRSQACVFYLESYVTRSKLEQVEVALEMGVDADRIVTPLLSKYQVPVTRGDIVRVCDDLYIWSGTGLQELEMDDDDYLYIPEEYVTPDVFPPRYWEKAVGFVHVPVKLRVDELRKNMSEPREDEVDVLGEKMQVRYSVSKFTVDGVVYHVVYISEQCEEYELAIYPESVAIDHYATDTPDYKLNTGLPRRANVYYRWLD